MKHYVCAGDCGAESDKPGICQAVGCEREGKPFIPCQCEDGEHDEAVASVEKEGEEDTSDDE